MFDGLFSGTSTNLGHLRLQTYVNSESHEECRPLLESFVESQKTFGYPLPRIVVLDMPGRDESLIHETIPSVKEYQEEIDRLTALQLEVWDEEQMEGLSDVALPMPTPLPMPTLAPAEQKSRIKITRTEADAANFATALLAMKQRSSATHIEAMALDTECDTRRNASGMINWSGLPELLQIGYDDNGIKLAWLIQLKKISKLHVALKTLLASQGESKRV
jgi:hypothetical protein